jgi:hypothetical protein
VKPATRRRQRRQQRSSGGLVRWRSPASGARAKARQRQVPAADRSCRGLVRRLPLGLRGSTIGSSVSFVLSIGEAGHEATTAPWRPASAGSCSIMQTAVRITGGSGFRPLDRSKPSGPRQRRRRQLDRRAVPGGGDRQRKLVARLRGIGCETVLAHRLLDEAGHEATTGQCCRRRQVVVNGWIGRGAWSGRQSAVAAGVCQCCRDHRRGLSCWTALDHRQFGTGCRSSSSRSGSGQRSRGDDGARVERCRVAIAGKWARATARRRTGSRSGLLWRGQDLGLLAGIGADVRQGCRRRGWPCWRCSIAGSSAGSSFLWSRSVKPATRRRRRQCRAVPGGDRRQAGQGDGETAQALGVLAVLDHRQFGRAADRAVSSGAGCDRRQVVWHRPIGRGRAASRLPLAWLATCIGSWRSLDQPATATTAPASSGWRSPASGPGRDSVPAADRSSGRLSGCNPRFWRGPCPLGSVKPATKRRRRLVAIAGRARRQRTGCRSGAWAGSRGACRHRLRRAPGLPPAWFVLAVLDHRQFGGLSSSRSVKPATKHGASVDRRQVGQVEGERPAADRGCPWSGGDRRQAGRGRRRDGAPAADRACRGLVSISGCWQASVADVCQGCRRRGCGGARAGSARIIGSSAGPSSSRSVKAGHEGDDGASVEQCLVAIAGKRARTKARQRTGCRSGVPWPGQALGVRAGMQTPGLPPAWPVLAALDHRQFGRAFVLSIGKASHEATTAPVIERCLEGDRRQAGQGEGETAHRLPIGACRGVVRVSGCGQASVADVCQGCRRRGPCWRRSIIGSSAGLSSSRSGKPATRRRRRQ